VSLHQKKCNGGKHMTNKSNLDVAFEIVSASKEPIHFKDLWDKVCEIQGFGADIDSKVGAFYTAVLLDGRFINLGDNTWDLRTRYTFEKATLDKNDCYTEDPEDELEEVDPEEENEEKDDSEDEDSEDDSEDEEKGEFEEE